MDKRSRERQLEDDRIKNLEVYMFQAEERSRDLRLADPDQLANAMLAARSAWRESKGTKDERWLGMCHDVARLNYDLAFVLRQNQTQAEMIEELIGLRDRIKNLEKLVAAK